MEADISSTAYAAGPGCPADASARTYGKPRGEHVPAVGRRAVAVTAPERSGFTAVA
ncbi:hypothetical protein QFZ24_008524 [Streptomyces phaeochromogenes]|uniref:hypothetical protein n=1 Tax=Streptomyces phaeochromogenes TaxID=1923 RepID=UPI00278DEEC3|nr:hypothetical protein [Streptomyces phaeochromogenes]MDQ0954601.1 hypothetical protein [Streptomyces phaeochromogenes]